MTNDKALEAALLACPFCGGEAHIVERDVEPQGDPWYGKRNEKFVECPKCSACIFDGYWHEGFWDNQQAAAAWNRRAPLSALPGEAEVVAWVDAGTIDLPWEKKIVATNPEYVERNGGLGQFQPLVTLASLQAMQARAEKAERENEALVDDAQKAWSKHGGMEIAKGQWQARAEAAEARVKVLEEALNLIDALDPEEHLFGVSHDACRGLIARMGEAARTALKGEPK